MAKKATHSELPWEEVPGDHLIMDANGITVLDLMDGGEDVDDDIEESQGEVSSARAELNKALIVKAVNMHASLVRVVRDELETLQEDIRQDQEVLKEQPSAARTARLLMLITVLRAAGEKV